MRLRSVLLVRAESRSIISRFREGQPTFAPRIASFMLCDRSLLTGDFLSKPFRGPDYGAMVIRTAAGVVIFISLSLILLVVGNMIYTALTDRVHLRERVSY
ncbi:unnamed protein product [Heligmosomoides polygyrus]|uniref:Uncharacterized protein n=1 Tax=Heligmosomoides polygyrus TaxID=6339 RepID=A0A3P8F479_HELPZ|nr:unnamed protein product [Heligmosomoides polygyrus]